MGTGSYTAEQVREYMDIATRLQAARLGTALTDGSLRDEKYFEYFQKVFQSADAVPEELRDKNFKTAISRLEKALKEHEQ